MIDIQYPTPEFKIKNDDAGKELIWDIIRKKWLALTPEEWVRQNFIQYLIQVKKVPSSMIAVEKTIKLPHQKKRFDIVVYKNTQPYWLIECKQPAVVLDEQVLQQALQYNYILQVPLLIITNGIHTLGWQYSQNNFYALCELPSY